MPGYRTDQWVSVLLLFNANSQLYPGENSYFQWDDEVRFVLDQHAKLDFYSVSTLKQQSLLFPLNDACLAEKQQIPM